MDITTSSILEQLRGYAVSAAITTSLQLGLYWQLEENDWTLSDISDHYSIPSQRCHALIELLIHLGLIERRNTLIKSSKSMMDALNSYGRATWEWIAFEGQRFHGSLTDLISSIVYEGNVWEKIGFETSKYTTRLGTSQDYARKFSLGLADMHRDGVQELVDHLQLSGDETILDLGGGVGLLSGTLSAQFPEIDSTVMEQANVSALGKEFCSSQGWNVKFLEGDFVQDPLPLANDIIMMSDVGPWNSKLFAKVRDSLAENGRFVICTNYDGWGAWIHHNDAEPDLQRRIGNMINSIGPTQMSGVNLDEICNMLQEAEFFSVTHQVLESGILIIDALKDQSK